MSTRRSLLPLALSLLSMGCTRDLDLSDTRPLLGPGASVDAGSAQPSWTRTTTATGTSAYPATITLPTTTTLTSTLTQTQVVTARVNGTTTSTDTSTATNRPCPTINTQPGVLNEGVQANSFAFSPDGSLLAAALSGFAPNVCVWRMSDGTPVTGFPGHEEPDVLAVAFSPNGKLLASAGWAARMDYPSSPLVKVWDTATGLLHRSFLADTGMYADALAFTADSRFLAVAGYSFGVQLWDVDTYSPLWRKPVNNSVHNVHVSPDGASLLVASCEQKAFLFSLPDGTLIHDRIRVASEMAEAAFSPDGKLVASTGEGNVVNLWEAATGKHLGIIGAHPAYISHVVWIGNDRILTNDWQSNVTLTVRTAADTFEPQRAWNTGDGSRGIAVTPDHTRFVTNASVEKRFGFAFFTL